MALIASNTNKKVAPSMQFQMQNTVWQSELKNWKYSGLKFGVLNKN